jgi:hypothetical protein
VSTLSLVVLIYASSVVWIALDIAADWAPLNNPSPLALDPWTWVLVIVVAAFWPLLFLYAISCEAWGLLRRSR